jgi:hypothetical protein
LVFGISGKIIIEDNMEVIASDPGDEQQGTSIMRII